MHASFELLTRRFVVLPLVLAAVVHPATAQATSVLFSAAASNPSGIQSTVDSFRLALGTLNPNVPGSFATGRREINWDGVPDIFAAPNLLPADFFNVNSPRGVIFSTPGSGFEVSGNAGVAPVRFDNINPLYSSSFQTFSAQRLFTAVGSPVTDVNFFVPGSVTAATVSGFGAVFTDVDLASSTSLQLFDTGGGSLGTFSALPFNNGLSFLGIVFNAGERIGRVRITSGNSALGPNDGGATDVVVMDDFIYGEPGVTPVAAVPEPASLLLLGSGLVGAGVRRYRKRRAS